MSGMFKPPKVQTPAPPPPSPTPETPRRELGGEGATKQVVKKGRGALRIDLKKASPGGAGVNLPR